MAFLFADPLVLKDEQGLVNNFRQPIDIDEEFEQIVENLQSTGKRFSLLKQAISFKSLQ